MVILSGNQPFKKAGKKDTYTPQQIQDLAKCVADPIYFCENFMQVQHPEKGRVPFVMYEYQKRLMQTYADYRFTCALMPRQSGKTTTAAGYLLWYSMFHEDKTILIVANKLSQALEIMKRIRFAYESLPDWLRAGAAAYNKQSIEFANGSTIIARATTADAGRGLSPSVLYCVGGENKVRIRNKQTLLEEEITMQELYERLYRPTTNSQS